MLEAFKIAGAIVAFATGAFTVWDRWARGRPLAWVTAKKFGANSFKYIRIKNPGPADVFIRGVRVHPKIYGIARDHSERAVGDALDNLDVNVLLWAGEVCDLPIWERAKSIREDTTNADEEIDQRIRFVISWRKTSSSWVWQAPVRVFTSTDDIKRIATAVALAKQ